MNKKKILKTAGKVIATIASPPIGAALWPKKTADKVGSAICASLTSVIISACAVIAANSRPNENTCNNYYSVSTLEGISYVFTSPLAFIARSKPHTYITLDEGKTRFGAYNQNTYPISFRDGRYQLDFTETTKFQTQDCEFDSIAETKTQVHELEQALSQKIQEGNIVKARKIEERLSISRATLEGVQKNYTEIREIYQQQVDSLNSELERLSSFAQ